MRKIFTFLCAALMSVGMFATTVTWDNSTLSSIYLHGGDSFTKDGVTLTVLDGMIDGRNFMGFSNDASFKFSTSLGNFTKIEITGNINALGGSGWTQTILGAVWTGEANETTFGMSFDNVSQIVFTIGDPAPTTYTLKLVADPTMGSVAVTNLLGSDIVDNGNGSYTVPENAKVTILATPNEGYEFTGWLEGNVLCDFIDCGTALNTNDNPLTFTMTNDAACKAEFEATAPQPAGEVTVVFAANDKTVERTVTLPHTFKCDWAAGMEGPDELDIIIHELYNDYYYCNSNMNASGSDQVEAGTEEDPKNDYITIKGVFEGTATVTGDYLDYVAGDYGEHNYSITISIKGDEPQPQETVVTITEADYVSGNTITKDGVTLTANQIYGVGSWYVEGPGTFTNTIGNFTKIEVTTVGGTVFIEGDGWTGDWDKKTWTGNAPSVSFVEDIFGKGEGFSIVCTIAAPEPEPAGKQIVVFEANGNRKEVEVESFPHTFSCSYSDKNGELDAIIKELYEISAGHCSDDNYPVASGNEAVVAGSNGFDNYITISAAFEGTATVSGWYWNSDAYDGDGDWMDYTLTISIKDTPTAVENVQTNQVQGTKILRDGQLLIEKNGKIFNVTGAQVR